jgi:transposase
MELEVFVNASITGESYKKMLRDSGTMQHLEATGAYFLQDNARPHVAACDYLKRKKVKLVPWPPYSPYLNVIEVMWANLHRNISRLATENPTADLLECAQRAWDEIPLSEVNALIKTFRPRLRRCIAAGGRL